MVTPRLVHWKSRSVDLRCALSVIHCAPQLEKFVARYEAPVGAPIGAVVSSLGAQPHRALRSFVLRAYTSAVHVPLDVLTRLATS